MHPNMRPYQGEDDYWRLRAFLREAFLLNGRHELGWQPARLDYWRWHAVANCQALPCIESYIFLWETADGQLAAALNPEGPGDAHLQIHPARATPALLNEMIDVAEAHLAHARAGRRELTIWAHESDATRREILARRGYAPGAWPEHQHQRELDGSPLPDATLPPGYSVRSLGEASELPARSWASWRAFHPDEPDDAYQGWEWYHNIQRCPMYRRDLDIVAVAPDGAIAGFCTVWYDDVTRTGTFEPVGIMPEHQQRGLGRAVMVEGLRRLERLGGTLAVVGGFSVAANALYTSVMGPGARRLEPWEKNLG